MDATFITQVALREAAQGRLRSLRIWLRDTDLSLADRQGVIQADRDMAKNFLRLMDIKEALHLVKRHVHYIRLGY